MSSPTVPPHCVTTGRAILDELEALGIEPFGLHNLDLIQSPPVAHLSPRAFEAVALRAKIEVQIVDSEDGWACWLAVLPGGTRIEAWRQAAVAS